MRLCDALALYLEAKEGENLTAKSLRFYRDNVNRFIVWLEDSERDCAGVTPMEVSAHLAAERRRGMSASSVDASYRALKAFFRWVELHEPDFSSPMGQTAKGQPLVRRPKRDKKPLDYVTPEEYEAFLRSIDLATWLDVRDYAIASVLYWTGLRAGELLGLRLRDVDLADGWITVREGKGRVGRVVPTDEGVVSALLSYLNQRPAWPSDVLWFKAPGTELVVTGVLGTEGLRMMLKRRCARAGIRFVSPHCWRRGCGMVLLNNGLDMSAVSNLLGHSSTKVTEEHYARWLQGGLKEQYSRVVGGMRRAGM